MKAPQLSTVLVVVLVIGSTITGVSGTVAAQESGQVIGQPNISFATTTGDVSAGTTDTLTLSITNRGKIDKGGPSQYESRVTTARGMTMSLDDENSPIDMNVGELSVGNVPTGSTQVEVPITVAESADPGTYTVPVEYEYQFTRAVDYDSYGAEYSDFTRTQTGSITVVVSEEAQFEVVSEGTNNVFAGDTGNLSFTLKNTGTRTATAASVQLSTQSSSIYFGSRSSASASTSLYVPSLDPGEKTTLSTQVGAGSETAAGSYPVDVVVSYRNHNGVIETSDTLTTGVTVRPERSFELRDISTENFRVDESEARINATVVNTGPGDAQNVAVQLGQTSMVTATNGESSVGDLAVGESASVSFTVSIPASAEPGTNTFPFTVQYENADGDVRTTETPIRKSIMIGSERAPFTITTVSTGVTSGGSDSVTVGIRYNGDQAVSATNAKLFVSDPISTSDDSAYLGTMQPGETMNATFTVSAGSAALVKEYDASIEVRYDDADGDTKYTDGLSIGIPVSAASGGLPVPLPVIAGVVLIATGGAYVLYRRR